LYIRQNPLFSFETLMNYQPKTQLALVLEKIDLTPCLKKLPVKSRRGPSRHPVMAMIKALVAKQLQGIPTVTELVNRLKHDLVFFYECGFSVEKSAPSRATFSRLFQQLSHSKALNDLFEALVHQAQVSKLIQSKVVAIDGSAINAYEHAAPKKDLVNDGHHANWGAKRDTHGNQLTWFGYKLHLAVDTASELPIAIQVTPASYHDSTQAIPLIESLKTQPNYYCLDMGYDTKDIYDSARAHQAQAIIPLNLRGEKEPPVGLNKNRTPVCSMGYPLVYWGCDRKRETLKFRCPHACGKVNCPQGSAWCSDSDYGLVVKKKVSDDPRSYCLPHRDTREWKKIYNQRTSVERVFGRLKVHLGANHIRVRGIEKVTAHLMLCCVTLIAGTLAINNQIKKAA